MKAYIFQAALWCAACAEAHKADHAKPAHVDESNESSYDSDEWPKGPYGDGGGEADCPQHCDACGGFLENPLTPDGERYVCEALAQTDAYAALGVQHNTETPAQWRAFYALEPTDAQKADALERMRAHHASLA